MRYRVYLILLCLLVLPLTGCTVVPEVAQRMASAEQKAASARLMPLPVSGAMSGALGQAKDSSSINSQQPIKAFARLSQHGADITVYIEGDGYAWVDASTPSQNPTPVNPVALVLAAADPATNVVYLGRPGQYTLAEDVDRRYWTSARFSTEVVDAYVSLIKELTLANAAPTIHLVGFSGGAAIAALVASRIKQEGDKPALTLRTVAGNLDTKAWTQGRRLSPMPGSLNPADAAAILQDIPQSHFTGSRDLQVPTYVLDAFLAQMSSQHCVRVISVNAGHAGPWLETWRQMLDQIPVCKNQVKF